jgi:hypothetical protein
MNMRFIYLDEAGISRHERFVVVAGIIVDADNQIVRLERHVASLVDKYIPESFSRWICF